MREKKLRSYDDLPPTLTLPEIGGCTCHAMNETRATAN